MDGPRRSTEPEAAVEGPRAACVRSVETLARFGAPDFSIPLVQVEPSEGVPSQPRERAGTDDRQDSSPEDRAAACSLDRTKIETGSEELSVILSKTAIKLRYFNQL